jgi:hypothetical protein
MSQPDSITVNYDPGTGAVAKTYSRYEANSGHTIYTEDSGHTLVSRDELRLYRTPAKKNGNFLGMAKSAAKITIDVPATDAEGNDVVVPLIVEVSASIYPSVDLALVTDAVARAAAFATSAEGTDLVQKLEI